MPLLVTKGYGVPPGGTQLIVTQGFGNATPSAGTAFILSVTIFDHYVYIVCGDNVTLSGDALDPTRWFNVDSSGDHVIVKSINVTGPNITLNTAEFANNSIYTVIIPNPGLSMIEGPCLGPFVWNVPGTGTNPFIVLARTIDDRTIDVIYNSPAYDIDATKPSNYTITSSGGLSVNKVEKISNTIFRLTTSHQIADASYTVTAYNIRNLPGNFT